jgi:hypothetical protein
MENLPTDWLSLLILTFVLGMKHGFDADHLATIDGLTRYNARTRPGWRAIAAPCSRSATAPWSWRLPSAFRRWPANGRCPNGSARWAR